ncbi:MAG: SRPBCC family protein [Dehalococcoidia bacterium]|nr:SRPBCC family protein [Dehalococcoidia bacterium]
MRFESSADVDASVQEAWAASSNPEEWPLWVPSIKKVDKLSQGPLGVGSQLCVTVRAGISVKLHMTIAEFVPQERVVMEGRILGTRLTRYYTLEPKGQKTRLAAGGEASGPLAWVVWWGGRALSAKIVLALKKRIEEMSLSECD